MVRKMKKLENCLSGEYLDTYKRKRKLWIVTSFVSIFFPFALSILIGICSGNFDLVNIFSQGDIIILFYSLTISMLFDLWSVKRNQKDDSDLQITFCFLLVVLFIQMALYGVIKTNIIENTFIVFIITCAVIISSYLVCDSALLQIFSYNIKEA